MNCRRNNSSTDAKSFFTATVHELSITQLKLFFSRCRLYLHLTLNNGGVGRHNYQWGGEELLPLSLRWRPCNVIFVFCFN